MAQGKRARRRNRWRTKPRYVIYELASGADGLHHYVATHHIDANTYRQLEVFSHALSGFLEIEPLANGLTRYAWRNPIANGSAEAV